MVAVIGTFIATACFAGFIGWCLSDMSYKQYMSDTGLHVLMVVFGWIPSVFVGSDLSDMLFGE